MNNIKRTDEANASGTCLQGYVIATYEELVKTFGEPNYGPNSIDGDKTTCEWVLEYNESKYCTIYDWKLGETPFFKYEWHIGGTETECVEVLQNAIEEMRKQ